MDERVAAMATKMRTPKMTDENFVVILINSGTVASCLDS